MIEGYRSRRPLTRIGGRCASLASITKSWILGKAAKKANEMLLVAYTIL
jgi:hypothetical protein